MQKIDLDVQPRDLGQKDATRTLHQLRVEGWVPGVLYGNGEPKTIAVEAKMLLKAIQTKAGINSLFTVRLGETSDVTIIKEIQRDIITRKPIHIDFQRINLKEKIEVTVLIHTVGEAPGVKLEHGILDHITREIRIKCLPDDIPPSLELDISQLKMHQTIRVKDLPLSQAIEVLTPAENIVVHVVAQKVEEVVAVPGATPEGAAPEVITKGKKDEEGAAAAGGAAAPAGKAAAAPAAAGDKKKEKAK